LGAESHHLVDREVPRLDAQQYPERGGGDHGRAALDLQRLVGELAWPLLAVVLQDPGREVDLGAAVRDQLAHLESDQVRELLAALAHQPGGVGHPRRALLHGRGAPPHERLVRGVDRLIDRRVFHGRELAN
jgi:hypothetical protein